VPRDIVDRDIKDMKEYTKSLIYEDKSLAQQIETYLKKREILDAETRQELLKRATGADAPPIQDDDYMDYFNALEKDIAADLAIQEHKQTPQENTEEEDDEDGIEGFDESFRKV
jgi:hypothetical protein